MVSQVIFTGIKSDGTEISQAKEIESGSENFRLHDHERYIDNVFSDWLTENNCDCGEWEYASECRKHENISITVRTTQGNIEKSFNSNTKVSTVIEDIRSSKKYVVNGHYELSKDGSGWLDKSLSLNQVAKNGDVLSFWDLGDTV